MDRSDSPSDSEDALPVHPEILDLAIRVYRTVWEQFYRWEEAECTSAIKECERPIIIPFEIAAESVADENTQHELEFHLDPPLAMGDNQDIESFTVEVFDENQNSLRYSTLFCPDVTREEIRPYPRYEFCTPASYSYVKEAHSGNALEFLPYADDDTFEIFKYLGGFDAYSWQTDFADPDLEMIQLEVANRLIVHEHFSQSEVDRLRMLRKLRRNRSSGLLWDTAQRDPLWWWTLPGEPTIPRDFVSKSPDVFVHIDKDIQNFCPKLNCLRSFCATHNEPYGGLHEVEPKLTSAQLKAAAATEACGTSCFRQVYGNNFPMAMVKWEDPSDVVKVEGILNLLPDSSPCDLAVICRKKCSEERHLCNKFHDEDISSRELDNPPRHVIPVFREPILLEQSMTIIELSIQSMIIWMKTTAQIFECCLRAIIEALATWCYVPAIEINSIANGAAVASLTALYVGGAAIAVILERMATHANHAIRVPAAGQAGSASPMCA
ncbi:hypothetical protein D9615_006241 [Tricholomella constricta]|uniref:Uncharacterized protein n=1 Tax=Tricholomella constricta TaxID=117010 RepID=A0A8H5HBA2_9AGAR|nr:hypothetical protein D9615_006241 [Tricholomella constricta]